ncbi:hypothetical protein C8T65DRAFT_99054 [Cerioporus squamosus]|nr:hypothetical protein C8T65DRAFT_99054 [Cerioporus squamosus]
MYAHTSGVLANDTYHSTLTLSLDLLTRTSPGTRTAGHGSLANTETNPRRRVPPCGAYPALSFHKHAKLRSMAAALDLRPSRTATLPSSPETPTLKFGAADMRPRPVSQSSRAAWARARRPQYAQATSRKTGGSTTDMDVRQWFPLRELDGRARKTLRIGGVWKLAWNVLWVLPTSEVAAVDVDALVSGVRWVLAASTVLICGREAHVIIGGECSVSAPRHQLQSNCSRQSFELARLFPASYVRPPHELAQHRSVKHQLEHCGNHPKPCHSPWNPLFGNSGRTPYTRSIPLSRRHPSAGMPPPPPPTRAVQGRPRAGSVPCLHPTAGELGEFSTEADVGDRRRGYLRAWMSSTSSPVTIQHGRLGALVERPGEVRARVVSSEHRSPPIMAHLQTGQARSAAPALILL